MLAVVLLWGTTFVLVKATLAVIQPQWFNALRMTLAFACLSVVYQAEWRKLTLTAWLTGCVAGIFLAAGYFFQTQGLVYTTPTHSAFITALVVVMVPCLTYLPALRSDAMARPTRLAWLGAIAAFLGVALLTGPTSASWQFWISSMNRGDLLTLVCAFGFSLHLLTLAHAARRVRFEQMALLQIGFAMLFLTLGALLTEHRHLAPAATCGQLHPWLSPLVVVSLLITGVLGTAVAFSVQTWAQQVIPATNLAVILTLEPVFAWLTAFMVLGERLSFRASSGAVLVLAAILTTEILPRWQRRAQATP